MQQIQKIGRKETKKKMRWLRVQKTPPLKPLAEDPKLEEFMAGVRDDVRALVGKHYYFIQVKEEYTMLCRVPLFSKGMLPHEVINHLQHGITDEDLDHAIGVLGGNPVNPGYYEISDHIEGKLRALLDA